MTPLRQRLFDPPNAVPDAGINMRNGWTVRPVKTVPPPLALVPEVPKPFLWPGKLAGEFWLPEEISIEVRDRLTVSDVLRATALACDVTVMEIKSRCRTRPLTHSRHIGFAVAKRLTPFSLSHIGRAFGGFDHTTVIHGVRKMARHIAAVAAQLPADAPSIEWARALRRRIEL